MRINKNHMEEKIGHRAWSVSGSHQMLGGTLVDKFTSKRADRVNDGSNIFKGRRNTRINLDEPNVHNNAATMMARRPSQRRYVAFAGDNHS